MENWFGVLKIPSTLPIDLGSYRFLGGGLNEQEYLLFSELFELNDDSDLNMISLRVDEENPYLRLYLEDNQV